MEGTEGSNTPAFSKRAYIWIGACLVAGFILPIVGPGQTIFINIQGLDGAPTLLGIELIYPLIAGIGVLIAANSGVSVGRAVFFFVAGALPYFLLWTSPEVQAGMQQFSAAMSQTGATNPLAGGFLSMVGSVGIFAGSRARSMRPASGVAAVIGAIGAGAYLLALLMPVQIGPGDSTISLLVPFKLIGASSQAGLVNSTASTVATILALGLIAGMVLFIIAAILCLINASVQRPDAEDRARRAFRMWVSAVAVQLGVMMLVFIIAISNTPSSQLTGEAWGAFFTIILKVVLWPVMLLVLTLFGATEWIVAASRPGSAAPAPELAVSPTPFTPVPQPAPVAEPVIPDPPSSLTANERLRRLQQMVAAGLITEEDYERKKYDILSDM